MLHAQICATEQINTRCPKYEKEWPSCCVYWVAVKELKLSYHIGGTIVFTFFSSFTATQFTRFRRRFVWLDLRGAKSRTAFSSGCLRQLSKVVEVSKMHTIIHEGYYLSKDANQKRIWSYMNGIILASMDALRKRIILVIVHLHQSSSSAMQRDHVGSSCSCMAVGWWLRTGRTRWQLHLSAETDTLTKRRGPHGRCHQKHTVAP